MEEVARECRAEGVRAIVCPADVNQLEELHAVAARTADTLGGIDAWVNNAGVFIAGTLEETPPDVWRRVLDTNVVGVFNGARAALPYLRKSRGALVNVASLYGILAGPKVTAYCASKFAVRGLSEALRVELRGSGVDVCTVFPASVDTPIWQHAGNYTGRRVRPMEPIYSADRVARAIVSCIERPRRERVVGLAAKFFVLAHTLTPSLAESAVAHVVRLRHFEPTPVEPNPGIAFEPMEEGTGITGGWKPHPARRALIAASLSLPPLLVAARWGWRQVHA